MNACYLRTLRLVKDSRGIRQHLLSRDTAGPKESGIRLGEISRG